MLVATIPNYIRDNRLPGPRRVLYLSYFLSAIATSILTLGKQRDIVALLIHIYGPPLTSANRYVGKSTVHRTGLALKTVVDVPISIRTVEYIHESVTVTVDKSP